MSLKGRKRLECLKRRLEEHYRHELDLIYKVLQLPDDEVHEILEWFTTSPAYRELKEVIDDIRERGRREEETGGNSNKVNPRGSEKESD